MESYAEALRKSGVHEEEALRRAQMEFGGMAQVKEECRRTNGRAFLENLRQDVRFAHIRRDFDRQIRIIVARPILSKALAESLRASSQDPVFGSSISRNSIQFQIWNCA